MQDQDVQITWNISRILKAAGMIGGGVAGVVSIATAWTYFGLPLHATRAYVDEHVRPIKYQLLLVRRDLADNSLFLWEQNQVKTRQVQKEIDRLRSEIERLDKEIAAMN